LAAAQHTVSLTGGQLSAIRHRDADRSAPALTASATLAHEQSRRAVEHLFNQAQALVRELREEHQHRVSHPEASVPDDVREVGASRPASDTARSETDQDAADSELSFADRLARATTGRARSADDQDAADSELSFADRLARAMNPELDAPGHRPAEQTVDVGYESYGPRETRQQEQGRGHQL
jgi:hypothetical protein